MKIFRVLFPIIPIFLVLIANFASADNWQGTNIDKEAGNRLNHELTSLMETNHIYPEKGQVGISVILLTGNPDTQQTFSINGDEPFFMASTYKVAIAAQLLHLVDTGNFSLATIVHLKPQDMVPGSGVLAKYFSEATVAIPAENLLQLMMQESDNTATDSLLELAGGPHAVNDRIQTLGINGMRIDRSTLQFFADFLSIPLPPESNRTIANLMKMAEHASPQSSQEFLADPRDSTTPNAMTHLLSSIYEQKALKPETTKVLLDIMSKKNENVGRLYLLLPKDVWVAQKLGTGEGVVNDVGIIRLPGEKGTLIMAIYLKNISSKDILKNKVSSLIARKIFDYYMSQ